MMLKNKNSPECNEGELIFDFDSVSVNPLNFDSVTVNPLNVDSVCVNSLNCLPFFDSPSLHSGEFLIDYRSSNVRRFSIFLRKLRKMGFHLRFAPAKTFNVRQFSKFRNHIKLLFCFIIKFIKQNARTKNGRRFTSSAV